MYLQQPIKAILPLVPKIRHIKILFQVRWISLAIIVNPIPVFNDVINVIIQIGVDSMLYLKKINFEDVEEEYKAIGKN